MPSWWAKSSKEAKKKPSKESFIDTLHRRFKIPSEGKPNSRSGTSRRRCSDTISEKGSQSRAESRSSSPSKEVSRCQSFAERPRAQPLPLPGPRPAKLGRTNSGISASTKPRSEKSSKSLFLPLPRPVCIGGRRDRNDLDGDLTTASICSDTSVGSDDPAESNQQSPLATDFDNGSRTAASSPSSVLVKDTTCAVAQPKLDEGQNQANLYSSNNISHTSPRRRPLRGHVPNIQIPSYGAFCSAPDSSMSSPSRSPLRAFGNEQIMNSAFWAGKPYSDVNLLGSGQCSSPGSGCNSGHNSMGGDMSGPLFWQQSRGSPEYSPMLSPRMTSPGPSRIHSGAVTPLHPRAGGSAMELQKSWPEDGKQQSHRLPLPPVPLSNSSAFSHSNSAATSPSVPRSPGRAENPSSPGSCWKKGRLLGRGTFAPPSTHNLPNFNPSPPTLSQYRISLLSHPHFSDVPSEIPRSQQQRHSPRPSPKPRLPHVIAATPASPPFVKYHQQEDKFQVATMALQNEEVLGGAQRVNTSGGYSDPLFLSNSDHPATKHKKAAIRIIGRDFWRSNSATSIQTSIGAYCFSSMEFIQCKEDKERMMRSRVTQLAARLHDLPS